MISPVSSAVLTGGIVATSNLITKHKFTFRQLAGVGIFVIFLAIFNEANPKIAGLLGLTVLITTSFMYVPKIITATGIAK